MRYGLVGDKLDHPLELRNRLVVLRILLVGDTEVEPRVGDRGVLLLGPLQLGDCLGRLPCPQERQSVVDALADRVRGQIQRGLELVDGALLRGRVLVEGLPEITVVPEGVARLLRLLAGRGYEARDQRGRKSNERRAMSEERGAGGAERRARDEGGGAKHDGRSPSSIANSTMVR